MKKVAVIGVGQTKFGELWRYSLRDMIAEAGFGAMKDSGVDKTHVGNIYIGNMTAGCFSGQEHLSALAAGALGMKVPSVRCEAACASGAAAFRSSYLSILAGYTDVSLAIGVEKMSDLSLDKTTTALMAASDQEWEASVGATFPALYAMIARAHMAEFGTTREQLAAVSVNNHKNGVSNKYAQFSREISLKQALDSTMVADPLTLMDCSPITDGAAAVVLASEEYVKKSKIEKPVWIRASAQGNDSIALHSRSSLTTLDSVRQAASSAFTQSGLVPEKIDLLEVHDCFTINELVCIEDIGFVEKGKSGKFVEDGEISLQGRIPVNTTGGLKSIGHPVGATGIRQVADIARQLRGDSVNQLKSPENGLALNVGGSGATSIVHILSSEPVS